MSALEQTAEGGLGMFRKFRGEKAGDVRHRETDAAEISLGWHTGNRPREAGGVEESSTVRPFAGSVLIARAIPVQSDGDHAGQASGKPAHSGILVSGNNRAAVIH